MIEFFQTQMGHRYYEYQLPELIKQLTRIADTLEKDNYVKVGKTVTHRGTERHPDPPEETRKPVTKIMDDLQAKGSGTFREPNARELHLLKRREAVRMGLHINDDEVIDVVESAKITVVDYMPDSPGWFGPLIFISYGAAYEYYEVLRVTGINTLESVKQAEDLEPEEKEPPDPDVGHFDYLKETDQLKSFDINETPRTDTPPYEPYDKNASASCAEEMSEKEAAELIQKLVPGTEIVKKYPPLKITRYLEEQARKIQEINQDFFCESPKNGPIVAILEVEIPESNGVVYITEYNNGNFWTEAGGDDITGTLEECIEHLKCEFP